MSCIYAKKKLNNSSYCTKHKCPLKLSDCSNCEDKEYRSKSKVNFKTNSRLIEKQKNRFSIIYHNLNVCCSCGLKKSNYNFIDLNEVYEGSRRQVSMSNGFVIPLCRQCHTRFHNDRNFALKYKIMFQKEFEKTHTRQDFLNLIHKSYL